MICLEPLSEEELLDREVVDPTNEGSENTKIIRSSKVIEQYDLMLVF